MVPLLSLLALLLAPLRGHLLSIEEQASMVSKLEYGQPTEESWLHFLFKSQVNTPPGSRAQVSRAKTAVNIVHSSKAEQQP